MAIPDATLGKASTLRQAAACHGQEEAVLAPVCAQHLSEVLNAVQLEGGEARRVERLIDHAHHGATVAMTQSHDVAGAVSSQDLWTHVLRPGDVGGMHLNHGNLLLRQRRGGRDRSVKEVRHGVQGTRDALGDVHDALLLLQLGTRETAVATTRVAPGLARLPLARAGPRRHPRLNVRRPALHAALLLHECTLAVEVLEDAAADDEAPHADCRDVGATEDLPREHAKGCGARLLRVSLLVRPLLAGTHLLLQADLAGFRVARRRNNVDHVAEGCGQPASGAARDLVVLLLVSWHGEGEEADLKREVDEVADPAKAVDDALPDGVRRQHAVVD
mmetsp:Transcript_12145/g.31184  ORF Transcript_12145/g.31184 Transcript_12145/m.31184 type:complete len:332 (+) Transcript_12145:584-1579(+)